MVYTWAEAIAMGGMTVPRSRRGRFGLGRRICANSAADHDAVVRTALDTARLKDAGPFQTIFEIVAA